MEESQSPRRLPRFVLMRIVRGPRQHHMLCTDLTICLRRATRAVPSPLAALARDGRGIAPRRHAPGHCVA